MHIDELREYCLSKKGVDEGLPFGESTLVFKVLGKIFALTGLDADECRVNLKCDPDYALELRDEYPDIIPGYHMNKRHWNTVYCERDLDDDLIRDLIDHSYELVVEGLPKSQQAIIKS